MFIEIVSRTPSHWLVRELRRRSFFIFEGSSCFISLKIGENWYGIITIFRVSYWFFEFPLFPGCTA